MNSPVPPHQEGRIAIVTDVDAGCGGRGSVGRAWQQGGRTARERSGGARTNGAETFSRKLRRDRYQARRAAFSKTGADGEVVWSWHPLLVSSSWVAERPDRAQRRLQSADDGGKKKLVAGEITYKP